MPRLLHSPLVGCLVGVLAAGLSGCGSGGPKLYPVRGQVFYQEKPAEGASVVLVPVGNDTEGIRPSGVVQADGSFTLVTHPHGEGAPAGEYVVVLTWYPADARQQENPRNKLPAQYGDASLSPLRATVKTEPTELTPFRLTR